MHKVTEEHKMTKWIGLGLSSISNKALDKCLLLLIIRIKKFNHVLQHCQLAFTILTIL